MSESITTYRKPGFPKLAATENSFRSTIEYIGPAATIEPAIPDKGTVWGSFQGTVISTNYEPTDNPTIAELNVVVELQAESPGDTTFGELEAEQYEIDWDVVSRPLYEHPQFAIGQGGASELTSEDIVDIEFWREETNRALKSAYQYTDPDLELFELSAKAKLFARGIELGQETWEDHAPIARKTSTYVGGPPGSSEAGLKDNPTGFANLPDGYEWRKSADRTLNAGSRTRFDRTEEWLGAKKVLSDKEAIFWDAP